MTGRFDTAAHWTAVARLIRAAETWAIAWHPGVPCWSAERAEGTAIRYLAGATTAELADLIDAAERRWVTAGSGPDWTDRP